MLQREKTILEDVEFEKNQACVGKVKNRSKSYPARISRCNVSFLWKKETRKLFKIDNPEYLVYRAVASSIIGGGG